MKRLGLYIPWALFLALCLGWTAYWFTAMHAAIDALKAAKTRANAAGVEASYEGVRASGYPLRLTLTLSRARLAPTPKLSIEAERLPVSINLSNPRHIIVGFGDGVTWRAEYDEPHTLTAQRGQMSLRLADDSTLARASLELEGAQIVHGWSPQVQFRAPPIPRKTEIGRLLVHLRPDPRSAADSQVVIEADDWRGLTPFAALNELGPFPRVRIAAVATQSASLVSRRPLATWTGALRIERVDVSYAGGAVTGEGELALDAAHRAAGVLRLAPEGGQTVELRAGNGWWTFAGLRVAPAKPLYSD